MPHFLKDFDPDRALKEQVAKLVEGHGDLAAANADLKAQVAALHEKLALDKTPKE